VNFSHFYSRFILPVDLIIHSHLNRLFGGNCVLKYLLKALEKVRTEFWIHSFVCWMIAPPPPLQQITRKPVFLNLSTDCWFFVSSVQLNLWSTTTHGSGVNQYSILLYRRPLLFAGVSFHENTANSKTANTKSNNNLKTGVPFLFSLGKYKHIYTKAQLLIEK
jgi:hypothetical protein